MGGDKGEGEQRFCHPHLSSPIKGEELHSNPVASYRELSSYKIASQFYRTRLRRSEKRKFLYNQVKGLILGRPGDIPFNGLMGKKCFYLS